LHTHALDGWRGVFNRYPNIPNPVLPPGVQIALVNIFDRLLGANYGDRRKSQQTERVTHNNSRSGSRTLSRINTRMYKYTHIGGWASSSNAPGLSGSQHRIHVGQEPPSDKMSWSPEFEFGFPIEITEIIMFMPLKC